MKLKTVLLLSLENNTINNRYSYFKWENAIIDMMFTTDRMVRTPVEMKLIQVEKIRAEIASTNVRNLIIATWNSASKDL